MPWSGRSELGQGADQIIEPSDAHRLADASIAVLPFANLSSDPEAEYFSDGMTEEIIIALSRVRGLRVAARSSSFSFKGRDVDARAIGEQLRVRTLLEGSVRRAGNRVRLTAQLISAADGYSLWSQSYERTLADVFAVQDELARAIAANLTQKVAGTSSGPLVEPPTESLDAYTLYLRGRQAMSRSDQSRAFESPSIASRRLSPSIRTMRRAMRGWRTPTSWSDSTSSG